MQATETQTDHAHSTSAGGHAPTGIESQREHLRHELHHYAHILSEQGPMNITFVHNNTLLGLQHLHFEQAITEAEKVLGSKGYEPIANFRRYHQEGRIADRQIDRALADRSDALRLTEVAATVAGQSVTRQAILRAHMVSGIDRLSAAELTQAIVGGARTSLQADLSPERQAALKDIGRAELKLDLVDVGRQRTVAAWVGSLLGIDLQTLVLESAHAGHARPESIEPSLNRLGIPSAQRGDYMIRLNQLLGVTGVTDTMRAAALDAECAIVGEIAQQHWGVEGSLSALTQYFAARPDQYYTLKLWQAALVQTDCSDALSSVEAGSLDAVDPERDAAERVGHLVDVARREGALPTLLSPAVVRTLEQALGRLESAAPSSGMGRLTELVRRSLGSHYLSARGVEALRAIAERQATAEWQVLLEAVQEQNPEPMRAAWIAASLERDVQGLSSGQTLLDWVSQLTGEDLVERVNHYMIRVCSAFMDEGLSAWRMPERHLGFYEAWRRHAAADWGFDLEDLGDWRAELSTLPERADDTVIFLLQRMGIPQAAWGAYVGRSLAQLKGWAGLTFWYETHPQHYKQAVQPTDTVQYLAVRLFVSWLQVRRQAQQQWACAGDLHSLQRFFQGQTETYFLCKTLQAGLLGDTWSELARLALSGRNPTLRRQANDAAWLHTARSLQLDRMGDTCWRLFRVAQHLGWSPEGLLRLRAEERTAVLAALDDFPEAVQSPVWLTAYERHYRDEILNALAQNHGRGRWANGRSRRPRSQLVLCIDEREENIHRHYGELDPDHETLGAAGFFGVAQSFTALDDHLPTPLCPAVATPAHRILEIPRNEALREEYPIHKRRFKWMEVFHDGVWETKRNLAGSFFFIQLSGLMMSVPLFARVLAPRLYAGVAGAVHDRLVPPVRTRVTHVRMDEKEVSDLGLHTDGLPIGFAIPEATDRVEAQLRNWGLTYQFARIVVICAHRSFSVNNPHENAHDCGACGGKPGGHNSRLFAALANDPQVRAALRERGIEIPDDTWFVGAEHNTASSKILCFDTEDIPVSLKSDWALVSADLEEARRRGARERCRRFGSAPKDASLEESTHHVEGRSQDLSQVRPEWGHCTNAFAVVGRRCVTQGLFLDRRGFIISYDPTQDPDGRILERILLAVGPVGAGINLEYYFSTVDPDSYGCGTKVPHNVTGMVGVMAGAHGDLQTGLPRQMTEVHEAMRLQLIVDAPMAVLGEIYGRQAGIRQLLDNQWVHLVAYDPSTGALNMFVPGKGFEQWNEPVVPLPEVKDSYEWFKGKYECFLPPARIAEPTKRWNSSGREI